jgi:predicted RNA-binding Zn-ribbon protein involved in translation (DUF1610 family)
MFKTSDTAAGKKAKCPKCGGVINIPASGVEEEIVDAEADTPSPFDNDDFAVEPPHALPTSTANGERKSCPMCGEMIARDAVKCRYCGEIFDPVLRAQEQKKAKPAAGDSDLSPLEWVVAILCSGIGCIIALVWIVQGKPKGTKMLVVSICAQVFWGLIQVVAQMATQR